MPSATQTNLLTKDDFLPLPCAHANCHRIAYLYRANDEVVPINRLIDVTKHLDLIANSIVYTPARAKLIVAKAMEALGQCECGPAGCGPSAEPETDFYAKAMAEQLNGEDVFRITLTSFLDVHTFDTRQLMKCCLAHVLPSGHVVPFCSYNTLYRDGHLPLPPLGGSACGGGPACSLAGGGIVNGRLGVCRVHDRSGCRFPCC